MSSEVVRHLQPLISEALTDTRVVGTVGPRQAGKFTLAQRLVATIEAATDVTLDDLAVRTTAETDPGASSAADPGYWRSGHRRRTTRSPTLDHAP